MNELNTLKKRVSELEKIISVTPLYILFGLIFIAVIINGIISTSATWGVFSSLIIIIILLIMIYLEI